MFDQQRYEESMIAYASRLVEERASSRETKRARRALTSQLIHEASVTAQHLNCDGWPDGTFEAIVGRHGRDRKAHRQRLVLISGIDWEGDVNDGVIVGKEPLWLGNDRQLYGRSDPSENTTKRLSHPFHLHNTQISLCWTDIEEALATLRKLRA